MKKIILSICVFFTISSFASETIKNTTKKSGGDNSIVVYMGTIAGPKKVFESTNCIDIVHFLKDKISEKPIIIMDGGYTVYLKNDILTSENGSLQNWLKLCDNKSK